MKALCTSCLLVTVLMLSAVASADDRPDVLFIAVDDLNHWVGYTGRNEQSKTPNIDRLSAMGVSFTNAHCAAPACNPSRAALMSGMRPNSTACYTNGDLWTKFIPPGLTMNHIFKDAGYYVAAMGKLMHSSANGPARKSAWNEYPKLPVPSNGGADKYHAYFEPLPLDLKDEDLGDWHTVDFCIDQLNREHDQPLFLVCGLIKPHLPWAVPRKYYDMFPLDSVKLPPHIEGDLDDIPKAGVRMAKPDGDHARFLKTDRWRSAVQSYLATIAYVDMNLGRLLDGLKNSPRHDNTIVVLWGDHGWHLGEKQHWRKFALWEEATRAPLIWYAPGVTQPGTICDAPVDFMSIYPTLCELTGVATPDHVEGRSIKTLLANPEADWKGHALCTHGYKNHAVRTDRWRYIQYADGSEELYDHVHDPYEWKNLAGDEAHVATKQKLAALLPSVNVEPTKSE